MYRIPLSGSRKVSWWATISTRSVESPELTSLPESGIEDRIRHAHLLDVAHAHDFVQPAERRREAVALLAAVVPVSAKGPPVEHPCARDLEQVVLREAAVALQGDGPAPERPAPERVLSDFPRGLPRRQDRERTEKRDARAGRRASSARPAAPARRPEDRGQEPAKPMRHQPVGERIERLLRGRPFPRHPAGSLRHRRLR